MWYNFGMTKLEQAIETLKSLPEEDQNFYAEWILGGTSTNDAYELSPEELAELDRRLASKEPSIPAEEVFAKFGL